MCGPGTIETGQEYVVCSEGTKGDNMLEFKAPTMRDKGWVKQAFQASQYNGCEYCFGNVYMWSPVYQTGILRYEDFFLSKGNYYRPSYSCPAGEGDFKAVVERLMQDARECGHAFSMHGVTQPAREKLEALFPDTFDFVPYRGGFDYIYATEDLTNLAGRKYHGKRNHIANFMRDNADWCYEDITPENLSECLDMTAEWQRANSEKDQEGLSEELVAVLRAFRHYFDLDLKGGLIRTQGKIVAYTVGEELNDDTFCLHIEKAFASTQGAYPMINREFAVRNLSRYQYINREEDMDVEGLRKAKLSYHPAILLEKFRAVLKAEV